MTQAQGIFIKQYYMGVKLGVLLHSSIYHPHKSPNIMSIHVVYIRSYTVSSKLFCLARVIN